ncbi:MAG: hypothetical protein DWI28_02030 [Planctomycetota bacterium]|nr:MAG: hypothetical protein DWI28_02030 [Planctomycetota bacterium]
MRIRCRGVKVNRNGLPRGIPFRFGRERKKGDGFTSRILSLLPGSGALANRHSLEIRPPRGIRDVKLALLAYLFEEPTV